MNRAEFAARLGDEPSGDDAPIVLTASEPRVWRRQFTAAAAGRGPVLVANPDWGSDERSAFALLAQQRPPDWDAERGWLMIPTGGSSGRIKLARHDHQTLAAAVQGFAEFVGVSRLSAVGVLPLHHIGGLMGWLRAALTGGDYWDADWKQVAVGRLPALGDQDCAISLVPTQLSRLLDSAAGTDGLRGFSRVVIGGAALDPFLAARARVAGINLLPSYGATETAAVAAAQPVAAFRAGEPPGLTPLPHVSAQVSDAGQLCWSGTSLLRSYWPEPMASDRSWTSGDGAAWVGTNRLVITGRLDGLINSGGEKVNPVEVETVLRELVGDDRIAVVGVPDPDWGECVVVVRAAGVSIDLARLKAAGGDRLAAFKWPKATAVCDPWPINAMGKLDRARLRAAANTAPKSN